jgi:large subunit ribosomal protein L9
MQVILLERIEKLGQMGDVVNVRSGYARNYLLPQKKAVTKTDDNMAYFESQRSQLEASNLENKSEAEKLSEKIEGIFVAMVRQAGEAGQLYGSVNARDIAAGVAEAGFNIDRRQITLERPIKTIGLHPVTVSLHPEVQVTVTANVARSADEAATQERTGEAVIKTDEDEADAPDLLAEALSEEGPAEAADTDADADADADAETDAEVNTEAESGADKDQNPVDEGDQAEA